MFADRLRKSLLQAAIQGQLTEQLPTDGNARDLLKKIRAEKAQLIADKKIKDEKPLPPVSDDEVPFDLPDNWCWCRLPEIVYSVGSNANQILAKEVQKTGKYPAVSQGQQFIDGYTDSADKLIYDVPLIMFGDHTRKVKYIDFPFVISADGTKFFKPVLVESRYFYWWMVLKASQLHNRGYNRHYRLLKLELFPLPPLAEQERIVEKLDALLSEVDELAKDERELVELEKNFPRRMKNSLLQAAITGKLTEQLPTDGDARDLLKKIRAEKAKLVADKKIKAEKPLPPVSDDEVPFDLPDNWCWCRLGEVCQMYTGDSIAESEKKAKYIGRADGFSYIGTKDVSFDNQINYDNGVRIPFENTFRRARKGSVLMCIEGGSAGRKIAMTDREVRFGNKLCNFNADKVSNRYIYFYLQSPSIPKILS